MFYWIPFLKKKIDKFFFFFLFLFLFFKEEKEKKKKNKKFIKKKLKN